jgi:hypothetical protein
VSAGREPHIILTDLYAARDASHEGRLPQAATSSSSSPQTRETWDLDRLVIPWPGRCPPPAGWRRPRQSTGPRPRPGPARPAGRAPGTRAGSCPHGPGGSAGRWCRPECPHPGPGRRCGGWSTPGCAGCARRRSGRSPRWPPSLPSRLACSYTNPGTLTLPGGRSVEPSPVQPPAGQRQNTDSTGAEPSTPTAAHQLTQAQDPWRGSHRPGIAAAHPPAWRRHRSCSRH